MSTTTNPQKPNRPYNISAISPWDINPDTVTGYDQKEPTCRCGNSSAPAEIPSKKPFEDGTYLVRMKLIAGEEATLIPFGKNPTSFLTKKEAESFTEMASFLVSGHQAHLEQAARGDNPVEEQRLVEQNWNRVRELFRRTLQQNAVANIETMTHEASETTTQN